MHPTTQFSTSDIIINYLSRHSSEILSEWQNSISINNQDDYKEEVPKNGSSMFLLLKNSINRSLLKHELEELALKVAEERAKANINIGDFVYNINIGRRIMIKHMNQSGVAPHKLLPFIDDINQNFDLFSYTAVKHYTKIKDVELQEKVLYINQTHKDRLSILGQLSSSFVHEFRNPLTSVMGFVKLLKSGMDNPMYLDIIDRELKQLNFRITQFLHTSKVKTIDKEKEMINVSTLIEELLEFIYPSILDGDIEIIKQLSDNKSILVNPDELKQVIINILLNSIEALKNNVDSRTIIISSYSSDDKVRISISNNGPMIPEQTLKTIFEPFYTTKELGTGIGLYVCKKIIEKHHGMITCDSNLQQTTFTITLPML